MKKEFEIADEKKIKELEPYIEKILKVLGYSISEVLITDESYITDFIDVFATREEKIKILNNISRKIGVEISLNDKFYLVAEKYKNLLVDIDLTEEMAFTFPSPAMNGWRCYRIEYGGCNEDCYYEGRVWYPPEVDSSILGYKFFEILQVPEARQELQNFIEKLHKKKVGKRSNWRDVK